MVNPCVTILTHKMCNVGHRYYFGGTEQYAQARVSNYVPQDGFGRELHFEHE